jgi:hypothetical protein
MKHVKLFEQYHNSLDSNLIDGKYLYHYTSVDNLDSIMEEGLKANKNPNYNGANAVFLTNKESLSKANLPQHLMDELNDFYDSLGEDEWDSIENDDRPIVRLTIEVSQLDKSKFFPDDDYLENRYGWNKAESFEDKISESLDIWGSVAYTDNIPVSAIVKEDYDYNA